MVESDALRERVPEPELMDEVEQVVAYAEADFDAGHASLFQEALNRLPRALQVRRILDLGCGPGDFSRRLARAFPNAEVVGVDGAPTMLERAASEPGSQGLNIKWVEALLDGFDDPQGFDLIFSNSLLHHLHKPEQLWVALKSLGREDGWIHISDLRRPPSRTEAKEMVETYSGDEPDVLKKDFYHSLCAAFTPEEISGQCSAAGLQELHVETFGDRHVLIYGRLDSTE